MEDYSLYSDSTGGVGLKRARAVYSPGGMLTQDAQPETSMLPEMRRRIRQRMEQAAELEAAVPDVTALQEFARQQGQAGESAMLNALAAQFAGDNFATVQAQFLKRASAAREPMKVGGGMLTPDGQFIQDPFAAQAQKLARLDRLINAERDDISAAERAEIARQQRERDRQDRLYRDRTDAQLRQQGIDTQRMLAQYKMSGGGNDLGAGQATQIGSGPNNEPVFRQKNGSLFTYDNAGQPVAYAGQVLPRVSTAQPTEDERKAAGWYFQADNAVRNIQQILGTNPGASSPSVPERIVGFVPGVGEDIANTLRPADRQRFVQASSSMAEALLRAATGAAITRQEIEQKQRELVPQIGDSSQVIKQKLDSYKVYMDSLRSRAGRAMPGGAAAPGAAPATNDPLGLRR